MDREMAWIMLYSGMVAFQYHPRNDALGVDFSALAREADQALSEWEKRYGMGRTDDRGSGQRGE